MKLFKLFTPLILGQKFLRRHSEISLHYGGSDHLLRISLEPQSVLNASAANLTPPRIFEFLATDCKPIAAKSRRYNQEDSDFIKSEVIRLLDAGIIEPAKSPWRAQVLVVNQSNGKKRLRVDYSVTINRYTYLDAYPLPSINEVINKVAQDTFYSSLDLKSAYHQVPLAPEERPMTAFEADGGLFQDCRLPFGVTNGVSAFQRVMDDFIKRHELKKVYAYLDDLTVTGATKEEHQRNLQR